MNTIKAGELFCKKYNEVYNKRLTPKEIFCDVISPLLFYGDKSLVFWLNSVFSNSQVEGSFEEKLNRFCNNVENDKYGVMTILNVFGGCAVPGLGKDGVTTMFCYSDNLYFDIDERYCSFIGSIFSYNIGDWNIVIENSDLIWQTYEGIIEYRKLIESDKRIKGNQLYKWNTAYIFIKVYNENIQYITSEFYKKEEKSDLLSLETKKINFFNFLFLINNKNIKKIEMFVDGKSKPNKSCGCVFIDISYMKRVNNIYKYLYEAVSEDFRYADFNKIFGNEDNIIIKAIENGYVTEGFFNPIETIKDINKNKYKQKYIEIVMNDEVKKLAVDFATEIKNYKRNCRNNFKEENIFKSKNVTELNNCLFEMEKSDIFEKVLEYLFDIAYKKDEFTLFMSYASFKFKYNK